MRIHTNRLTARDIFAAAYPNNMPDVLVEVAPHGSRSHARAFEVGLVGIGDRHTRNRADNFGKAATWHDWGFFFAALYGLDPTMRCGGSVKRPGYANRDDFHRQTRNLFNGTPFEKTKANAPRA